MELYADPDNIEIFDEEEESEVSLLAQSAGGGCDSYDEEEQESDSLLSSALNSLLFGKEPHRCDGDCANCPDHYGYIDGKWYYGHGHMYDCEFGGNGGMTGKCTRLI